MPSDFDYCALMERMTVPMHHCVRGFFLKHAGDAAPDEEDIRQWIQDDLDRLVDEISFEEREILEARLLRTISMRLSATRNGGLRGIH